MRRWPKDRRPGAGLRTGPLGDAGIPCPPARGSCRGRQLATQKIPERLELVPALPRNAMGKILKQELRKTYR